MNILLSVIESVVSFFSNLSWENLMHTYWFLFFVEFPRYYLLDVLVILWLGITHKRRHRRKAVARRMLFMDRPLVTILAPGKNEGEHIFKLVRSLREQTYRNYEIIIVDDGSDDATPWICRDLEKAGYIDKYLRLSVRGGKASAANYGAWHAKGKYIVHLDADSSLDRTALEEILLPFYYDTRIKGIGGCVKVRNADYNLCTSMQAIEYLKTIMVGRTVSSTLGIYHIISGAFGAFETEAIREVGCWDIGPGLDGDITQKLRKAGYRVYFAPAAICMTNVPVKWYNLFKQRLRWSKSLVRFRIRKHRDIFMPNKNFSFLNFLSNLENVVYDFILNYVWLFYIINLICTHTDRLGEILVMGWLIRFVFALFSFGIILLMTERKREELPFIRYLFLNTFYTGYFLRITRLIAHTMEFFFFSSYKDPWNPRKTSVYAQLERN